MTLAHRVCFFMRVSVLLIEAFFCWNCLEHNFLESTLPNEKVENISWFKVGNISSKLKKNIFLAEKHFLLELSGAHFAGVYFST